jgi:hypothetical protein
MAIHESWCSQLDSAAVLLQSLSSRIVTGSCSTRRSYARKELILVGTEEAVRSAVQRLVAPASGLGERV